MAGVSTYLNFDGSAEEALLFYRDLFGTELLAPMKRMAEMPRGEGPPLGADEGQLIGHASLPILGGHVLMATDMLASRGHTLRTGNNMTIHLELDDRAETERLFAALSAGASDAVGLMDMPWGNYWGTCQDRFGIRWMFSCSTSAP
jgi:PhnB protein